MCGTKMSNTLTEYEKARRTGGQRLHPESEKNFGLTPLSFWDKTKAFFSRVPWTTIFIAIALATIAFYLFNKFISKNPNPIFTDDGKVIEKTLTTGFDVLGKGIAHLTNNIETLVAEIRVRHHENSNSVEGGSSGNPDLPISYPPPIIKWKIKWKTKWRTNPIDAGLREENEELKHRLSALNYEYKLDRAIIDQFYATKPPAGYSRRLTYSHKCPPIDNVPNLSIIKQ